MSARRGIEPIIAAVILVAVALILAVVVVTYITGLFGGLLGAQPQITITNVIARKTANSIRFEIYVNNAGAGSDRIVRAYVIHGGETYDVDKINGTAIPSGGFPIPANFRGWVTAEATNNKLVGAVSPGDTIVLRIHFERSGVHTINVVVAW